METVTVVCDRCHRPYWRLELSEMTSEVRIYGARIADGDLSRYCAGVLRGPRAHRYRADRGARPVAFILPAGGPARFTGREKLV